MDNFLEYFVFFIIFLVFIIIIYFLGKDLFSSNESVSDKERNRENPESGSKKGVFARCPICGYLTGPQESVYAKYIKLPGDKKKVEILGCDNCIDKPRQCPRCKSAMGKRDVGYALLTARTIKEKKKGKNDLLHIEGCMNCYKR